MVQQMVARENVAAFLPVAEEIELSIVMPCLNEAETLAACVTKAHTWLRENNVSGEVLVADNGSVDGSQDIAAALGAHVVNVKERGYGSALQNGIAAARGRFVVMGDADDSYDFSNLGPFLDRLRGGCDLVMGNRFRGGIKPGAMPFLHKYLGNPVLTRIGRILFKVGCGDFHCGLRGFSKAAVTRLDLRTTGMEFASEMVVKASLRNLRISEVPTILSPDGRSRAPHLRTWRDGWRHLRFMLLYSPRWLFLYPSALLVLIGVMTGAWLLPGPRRIGVVGFDVHTLLYAAAAIFIGVQGIIFAAFTKVFAISEGLLPEDPRMERLFKHINLEVGLVVGAVLALIGIGSSVYAVGFWGARHFGAVDPAQLFRMVIPAVTSLTIGCQIILSSFFLSILGMKRR